MLAEFTCQIVTIKIDKENNKNSDTSMSLHNSLEKEPTILKYFLNILIKLIVRSTNMITLNYEEFNKFILT